MHVIAKPALVKFWTKHPNSEEPLQTWFSTMKKGKFRDFVQLKQTFRNADYVDGLTVFDIGGNKYRLIASIHYNVGQVYILDVLTHAEYDRNSWKRKGK